VSDAPRYTIRTVWDFAEVPDDRRAECLAEFLVWLRYCEMTKRVLKGLPVRMPKDFIWIDDGLHRIDGTISDGKTTIPFVSGVMRGFESPTDP